MCNLHVLQSSVKNCLLQLISVVDVGASAYSQLQQLKGQGTDPEHTPTKQKSNVSTHINCIHRPSDINVPRPKGEEDPPPLLSAHVCA